MGWRWVIKINPCLPRMYQAGVMRPQPRPENPANRTTIATQPHHKQSPTLLWNWGRWSDDRKIIKRSVIFPLLHLRRNLQISWWTWDERPTEAWLKHELDRIRWIRIRILVKQPCHLQGNTQLLCSNSKDLQDTSLLMFSTDYGFQ